MKSHLRTVALLCLLAHVLCDCQNDCVTCNKHLYQSDNFNTLVCIVECEGKIYSSTMWAACKTVLVKSSIQLSLNSFEEDFKPFDMEDGQFAANFKRLGDLAKVVDFSKINDEKRMSQISNLIREQGEEDTTIDGGEATLGLTNDPDEFNDLQNPSNAVSKRFGGFVKGKYSYRKFMGPSKDLQKRYGGFIGVRKSARKWNNQKRFSQFLRQYLGMSKRSAEYDGYTNDLNELNEQKEY
ncbi:prepronociceptin [Spea bombifrons]|uniref:prepronociceptin n=1 Tax=Spea bombifrons TaxID=233779 RepID=UPI00234AAEE1|nr:prepronociceptin [Spea bombifrons]